MKNISLDAALFGRCAMVCVALVLAAIHVPVVSGGSAGVSSTYKLGLAGCHVANVKTTINSPTELTLSFDYRYEGNGYTPLQVVAVIKKKGDTHPLAGFQSGNVQLSPGRGSLVVNVQYMDRDQTLQTDRIVIQFILPFTNYLLGMVELDQPVFWVGNKSEVPVSKVVNFGSEVPQPAPSPVGKAVGEQQPALAPDDAGGSFSAMNRTNRAAWQDHLTLGAGDVLRFALFGEPTLLMDDVFVGPDGRVSYLEAQGVMATGLTIDELRQKFDEELSKFRRSPRTMITPVSFQSKKYYVLGRVSQKGVFTLDRPVTVIEAVARARGFETGMTDQNLSDMADFSRSFIARRGERVRVDFEKLFMQGDLSQNIPLEPGDYLYFSGIDAQEIQVLGEVKNPGLISYTSGASTIGSIAQRGGFTEKAWKGKVLVVRGSLNRPETFVVDSSAILSGRETDFKLQPRDIVFVNSRPFVKAEELLDVLASAFVQAAVITWTGGNIGSVIK